MYICIVFSGPVVSPTKIDTTSRYVHSMTTVIITVRILLYRSDEKFYMYGSGSG